jgi:hypothetical protein
MIKCMHWNIVDSEWEKNEFFRGDKAIDNALVIKAEKCVILFALIICQLWHVIGDVINDSLMSNQVFRCALKTSAE